MAMFKDTAGREWLLQITPWGIKQVLARTGVHLGKLLEDKLKKYGELVGDPAQLVDVIFVLCSEQAEKQGVTDEQFGRSFSGDTYEAAVAAFEESFTDFCPSHLRKVMKSLRAKVATTQTTATEKALTAIEKLDVFSLDATNSAASSVSIQQG